MDGLSGEYARLLDGKDIEVVAVLGLDKSCTSYTSSPFSEDAGSRNGFVVLEFCSCPFCCWGFCCGFLLRPKQQQGVHRTDCEELDLLLIALASKFNAAHMISHDTGRQQT